MAATAGNTPFCAPPSLHGIIRSAAPCVSPLSARIGPNCLPGDSIRHWVHWPATDDHRSLYDPLIGIRRQAEWDDHGEAYPIEHEGPDIWIAVKVPAGMHRVSLYFMNKDGHTDANRSRDYRVAVQSHDPDINRAVCRPPLAVARVRAFWGGVYKQFAVRGPGQYHVHIARDYSVNAICAGVFLDRLTGEPDSSENMSLLWLGGLPCDPPPDPFVKTSHNTALSLGQARELWSALTAGYDVVTTLPLQRSSRILACRAAQADNATRDILGNWRWTLPLWTPAERSAWVQTMARAWFKCQLHDPDLRTKKYRKYSPNTYETAEEWARINLPPQSSTKGKEGMQ